MLEGTIVLTLLLGKDLDGAIIAVLLVLNSVIGFAQQSRADDALELLRKRLAVNARVRRDGRWVQLAARDWCRATSCVSVSVTSSRPTFGFSTATSASTSRRSPASRCPATPEPATSPTAPRW